MLLVKTLANKSTWTGKKKTWVTWTMCCLGGSLWQTFRTQSSWRKCLHSTDTSPLTPNRAYTTASFSLQTQQSWLAKRVKFKKSKIGWHNWVLKNAKETCIFSLCSYLSAMTETYCFGLFPPRLIHHFLAQAASDFYIWEWCEGEMPEPQKFRHSPDFLLLMVSWAAKLFPEWNNRGWWHWPCM